MQRLAARIALAASLGLMSATAFAGSFNYNYAEAGIRFPDYEGSDAIGVGGLFSYDLMPDPHLRFLGSISYDDLSDPDGTVMNILAGVGYIHPVQPDLDIVGDVGLLYNSYELDIDTPFGTVTAEDDDIGLRLAGFVRWQAAPKAELQGGLNYVDLYDDGELGINLGAYLKIDEKLTAMLRYDDEGDVDTLTLGARFDF